MPDAPAPTVGSGTAAPLAAVATQLAAADVAIGNLESPLSSGGSHDGDKDYTFRGDPRGIAALELAGFDAVSLGNNHALDWGAEALADTVALLDESGIGHAGAGADKSAAVAPAVTIPSHVERLFSGALRPTTESRIGIPQAESPIPATSPPPRIIPTGVTDWDMRNRPVV